MNYIYRGLITILLLPICYTAGKNLVALISLLNTSSTDNLLWIYFLIGAIGYMIIHFCFFKPIRLYIFGHELTHAAAGILSGAKIKSFIVKKDGGSVGLTKVNMFVALSPYFIPIYSLILIICYKLLTSYFNTGYPKLFVILLGMTVSFHLVLTLFAASQKQSDFQENGTLVSLLIIFVSNCVILSIILIIFFPLIKFTVYTNNLVTDYFDLIKTAVNNARNYV